MPKCSEAIGCVAPIITSGGTAVTVTEVLAVVLPSMPETVAVIGYVPAVA